MLWLDGAWPREGDEASAGVSRGDCAADSGVPDDVIANQPDAYVAPSMNPLRLIDMIPNMVLSYVTWSNIRFGPIGSTTE